MDGVTLPLTPGLARGKSEGMSFQPLHAKDIFTQDTVE